MSTRNALGKCHGSQEKADFPNKTRRPDADGRSLGRQSKGFAATTTDPNSKKLVGNPAGVGVCFGTFCQTDWRDKDHQSSKAVSKIPKTQTFFAHANEKEKCPKIRAAAPR